jgi:hypothetical protein
MARRLKTFIDVRRYLASLINRVESKQLKPEVAGRLAYISNILLRAIETMKLEDVERRLTTLEEEKNIGS